MKHRILFACLPLCLLGLASCGQAPASKEDQAHVRDFVSAMAKGETAYNGLAFKTSFQQKYKIEYEEESEVSTTRYDFDYDAEGSLTVAYAWTPASNETFDIANVYDSGSAYLSGEQKETAKFAFDSKAKDESGKTDKQVAEDYIFHHIFGIEFDQVDFYAQGKDDLNDKIEPNNNRQGSFQGHIAKDIIPGYASSTLRGHLDRILYMDAWKGVSSFREAMADYFEGIDVASNDSASNFVHRHNMSFSEANGVLKAEFFFDLSEVLNAASGKKVDVNGTILGIAEIDAANHRVARYEFDFKDAYTNLLKARSSGKKSFQANVESFVIKGELLDLRREDLHLNGEFVDYPAERLDEFIEGFEAHVVPNISEATH